ncbi:MAG: hypothetical protein K6F53_11910 [Lachnospiraceae bacterium]|nr:hypothetical protein [Lachnospiraceae bacterium]
MVHLFIVNSYAGKGKALAGLREKLSAIPNLDYFIFHTRNAGNEPELVREALHIFEDERVRIYSCGGSGTMRNILTAIPDLSKVEVAFYPCGLTNDFLKVFGTREAPFYKIENLISGKILEVDYLKSNYGIALNTISTGMDAALARNTQEFLYTRFINQQFPYYISLFKSILTCHPLEYEAVIDDRICRHKCFELVLGNGKVLGGNLHFTEDDDVRDGIATACFGCNRSSVGIIPPILSYMKNDRKKIEEYSDFHTFERMVLRRKDGKQMDINMDGELVKDVWELTVEVVKRGLRLVVPDSVI